MPASVERLPDTTSLASLIDLTSSALGGHVLSASDEWFCSASNLLNPAPPVRKPGHFVETGAWYDGWETRRHNPEPSDWAIIALGVSSGYIHAIEIDTAFFNGNHAPSVSVSAVAVDSDAHVPPANSDKWEIVLPEIEAGPSERFIWKLSQKTSKAYTHVKLEQYPDGGIARFRVYGEVVPVWPSDVDSIVDMAAVENGGVVIAASDQHFGRRENLNLPGRGQNMGDGWETKRSREPGHVDWAVVKLYQEAFVEEVVVDTLHFRGNFPREVEIWARSSGEYKEGDGAKGKEAGWWQIVGRSKCQKDKEHAFTTSNGGLKEFEGKKVAYVKMVIVPDGGVKRLRVFGKRAI